MTLDKDAKKSMIWSLVIVHIWGSVIILAMVQGRDSAAFAGMFDTIGWMIFSILGVLATGKGVEALAQMRMGGSSVMRSVVEEKTITSSSSDTPPKKEEINAG